MILVEILTCTSSVSLTHFVVSRTCTAPFDRLKIFFITRPPELTGPSSLAPANAKVLGVKIIL
jgi:hypothetical protein